MDIYISVMLMLSCIGLVLYRYHSKNRIFIFGMGNLVIGTAFYLVNLFYKIPFIAGGVDPKIAPIEGTPFISQVLIVSGIVVLFYCWSKDKS
ncbi:MAG: hypothetical protein K6L80_15545 [Agarilytica sp.]